MPPATTPRTPRRTARPAPPLSLLIEHENLDDKVYARLKRMIADRQLGVGQRIFQEQLARQMGVSRTPLVNALKRLAQERLVEWVSRRGIYVRRFTRRELVRLWELREVLEGLSARLAATRISREEVDRLEAMFRGLDVSSRPAAVRKYVERDRYFHQRLVQIAGNEHLAAAMESVNMMIFAYQIGLVRPAAETVMEHYALLDALRRQDAEASEALMRLHNRRSLERLQREADTEAEKAG